MKTFYKGSFGYLIFLGLFPLGVTGAECSAINGFEFLKEAKSRNWAVYAEKVNGEGNCSNLPQSTLTAGAANSTGITCRFTFFENNKLIAPWKFGSITFSINKGDLSTATFVVRERPNSPSSGAKNVVDVTAASGEAITLVVDRVRLISGNESCDKWKSALGD